ncbi:chorismate mutase [Lentilactobacillus diolivorans]|uniref:Chorismate mutase domain-containing protein n=2 Tax=Lentilactobacillus diolivorans TaxID=179838 RepID=A0A0R1SE83_9LACO|nr:chorismate mutase [Lentilactobacillus diolivorans]KRL64858.1 hypothetical protein FC85_GL000642 [Lentilactobacillus diolivorans DSM 14421]GEP23872.1 hypothetical protein LDI01_14650 [Lentilactobacillus diolivorans]
MNNNQRSSVCDHNEEIQSAREQINQLDQSIVELLVKRFETSARISRIKRMRNLPVLDSDREAQVLKRVASSDPDPDTRAYIQDVYRAVMENSRKYQHQLMNHHQSKK